MTKGKQVRVSENTVKLIRIFAGELQMETGEAVSDDKAIAEMFKQHRPDLYERLIALNKTEKGKPKQ